MPKRKAVDLPKGTPPPNRRRTRSSGLLAETQPPPPPPKKRARGRPPGIPASEIARPQDGRESSNENDKNRGLSNAYDASDDELDMLGASPSKTRTGHTTPRPSTPPGKRTSRKRGQIMDAVVITTPKSSGQIPRSPGGPVVGSPSPSRPVRTSARTAPPSSPEPPRDKVRPAVAQGSSQVFPRSGLPSSPYTSIVLSDALSPSRALESPSKHASAIQPLPRSLPFYLIPSFQSQKAVVLHALQYPPPWTENDESTSTSVFSQLTELMNGTTKRNEGNSCLILGPRGSGKTRLVDRVLQSLPSSSTSSPVIIRLSAHCQTNDRLAMREIARQVHQQIGSNSSLQLLPGNGEEPEESVEDEDGKADVDLPPPSHLPALMSALPALGRPVVIVLDAFDGFAAHARQALLYCLLDTVQSCRGGHTAVKPEETAIDPPTNATVGQGEDDSDPVAAQSDGAATSGEKKRPEADVKGEHGLLVIGMTSRVDCLTLLEKRVKSRFSHRVMRVRTPASLDDFLSFARHVLSVDVESKGNTFKEWKRLWEASVEKFLREKAVLNVLNETFAFVKDLRVLCRLLISPVIALTPGDPWLTATQLTAGAHIQRCPKRFPFLPTLPYPHIALLIAAAHSRTAGHETFNFEMLYDKFMAQVRTSASAPIQIEGGGIGMVKIGRGVMVGAFEHLIATHVFYPVAPPSTHVTREFAKYRCVAEWDEIKTAVDHLGQTNLKKWFSKAQ